MAEDLTRWEYKYWYPKPNDIRNENVKTLEKFGQDGWEITGSRVNDGVILKRPMQPKQPQRNVPPYNPPYNGR